MSKYSFVRSLYPALYPALTLSYRGQGYEIPRLKPQKVRIGPGVGDEVQAPNELIYNPHAILLYVHHSDVKARLQELHSQIEGMAGIEIKDIARVGMRTHELVRISSEAVIEGADSQLRASMGKMVGLIDKPRTTAHELKRTTSDWQIEFEAALEAGLAKLMAKGLLERADAKELVDSPTGPLPATPLDYAAAVKGGVDVRTRIFNSPDLCSSKALGSRMGVSRQTVDDMRRRGALLAVSHLTRAWRYPCWQVEPEIVKVMPQLLKILEPLAAWTKYFFLTDANPALDELSPVQALKQNHEEKVLAVATGYVDEARPIQ